MEDETSYEQKQKKYKAEDTRYWKQLHQELEQIKEELKSTNVELAQGLGISRQSLFLFLNQPEKGLPIYRSNLLQLWDFLTESKQIKSLKDKKNSDLAIKKREQLRKDGPEKILRSAGFLTTDEQPCLVVDSRKSDLIKSIVSRLEHSKFNDYTKFSSLIDDIKNKIAEISSPQNKGEDKNLNDKDDKWLDEWIYQTLEQPDDEVLNKFKSVIDKYRSLGKTKFFHRELYELYMTINDNQMFFSKINNSLKIQIIDCDFTTLTFEIKKYFLQSSTSAKIRNSLKDKIVKIQLDGNKYLGQNIKSSPVIKTLIKGYFEESKIDIKWDFISSATHIDNLLAAVEYGMGYRSLIELNDFSIKALERKYHSLAKIVVGFSEVKNPSKIYQGCWVDYNAILGMLQAVVNAVTNWLSLELIEKDEPRKNYCKICQEIFQIRYESASVIRTLDEYYFLGNAISKSEKIIGTIEQVIEKYFKEEILPFSYLKEYLKQKIYETKLVLVYAALLQGNLNKATAYLYSNTDYENNIYQPIVVLYNSADITYKFLSGQQSFLNDNKWRNQLEKIREKLCKYIKDETGFIRDENFNGSIDLVEYRSASEIFGNTGRIEFYLSTKDNRQNFEKQAIDNFLLAAYYASKIGQKQRTSHWLLMASRAYCRLNRKDEAEALIEIAKNILEESILDEPFAVHEDTEKKDSVTYKKSLKFEIQLANGELFLLEGNADDALSYFLESLKGAIYLGFALLIADSLYNIYRSAIKLSKDVFSEKFQKVFPKNEPGQDQNDNQIVVDVLRFLKDESKQLNSEEYKHEAQSIWNTWFKNSPFHEKPVPVHEQHVVAKMMESDSFLERMAEN
ncbi:hypothetical protein [Nostoc sp. DedSLP04]|uniref:hypothetical protein n=1 Tax=Nostoc sp. DedSLP04 TaxID=3075401 RepID=UPI002AD4E4DC|nr:hypothetical protein [Nostoc sp. DedSLP04]MDZ8032649.1 hypothetical protein [Nostoc sp. DedSLP04]